MIEIILWHLITEAWNKVKERLGVNTARREFFLVLQCVIAALAIIAFLNSDWKVCAIELVLLAFMTYLIHRDKQS